MRKLNKKGFTLIEMLVVIAIIAILVSIIVPVVGNSTTKAAAATNAANLRSVAAEVAIRHLEDPVAIANGQTYEAVDGVLTLGNGITVKAPASKAVKDVIGKEQMKVTITSEEVIATYGDVTLDKFADIADNGKADGSNGGSSSTGGGTTPPPTGGTTTCGCTEPADVNDNGTCDACGHAMHSEACASTEAKVPESIQPTHTCADVSPADHICDDAECGATLSTCADANNDCKCDVCEAAMHTLAYVNGYGHNCSKCNGQWGGHSGDTCVCGAVKETCDCRQSNCRAQSGMQSARGCGHSNHNGRVCGVEGYVAG